MMHPAPDAVGVPLERALVVGVDFGTLSGRAVVVRVSDGAELGSGVLDYPHGVMSESLTADDGQRLPSDWALQAPQDHLEVLRVAVPAALADAGVAVDDVVGIGVDVTSSTLLPTTADGTPLCWLDDFRDQPHAWTKLWKHHAAQSQADRMTELARERREAWLGRYGGLVSSEWAFPKMLQVLEEAPEVYARAAHFVEATDWLVWQLCGTYLRNATSAGFKAMLQDDAYPSRDYLAALNPAFAAVVDEKLSTPVAPLGSLAGRLDARGAALTGLREGIAVAVGNVDAHVTAPAADACEPGQMVAIMGTSTCLVMNGERRVEVPGMSGVVTGGITAGRSGYEAGQSGVGDIFGWFVTHCVPAEYHDEAARRGLGLHELLTERAAGQAVGEHGLVALDWWNGNRSVLVDHELSGMLLGLTLATRPEDVYRALLEATAFGMRTIIEAFETAGVAVDELVVAGGLLRNDFLMQLYADVTRRRLSTITSSQGPALGSAIHAAVAAGYHPDVVAAGHAMGSRQRDRYLPDESRAQRYDLLFAEYRELHDWFGRGGSGAMARLRGLRRDALAARRSPSTIDKNHPQREE